MRRKPGEMTIRKSIEYSLLIMAFILACMIIEQVRQAIIEWSLSIPTIGVGQ